MTTSKIRVSTYIDEKLKTELEALAKIQKRSLGNMIEVICQQAIDKLKKD